VMMQTMGEGMAQGGPMLFGRRTYEDFHKVWPGRKDSPFSKVLDDAQKYVASRTLREPLPWQNSTLLEGDAAKTVARLKQQPGKDIVVLGSGDLLQTLMRSGLVDHFLLSIHPLVLGRGRRLFDDDGARRAFRLVRNVPTTTGVLIAGYEPA
jgi:dihydrofolate reductase